jgi:acyl carrier protein
MTIEEILIACPGLEKVTFNHYKDFLGDDFDPNKTWIEMGFDDLDIVELIMHLEKKLDFEFPDYLVDKVFGIDLSNNMIDGSFNGETHHNTKPINFIEHIREQKLNDLGI